MAGVKAVHVHHQSLKACHSQFLTGRTTVHFLDDFEFFPKRKRFGSRGIK